MVIDTLGIGIVCSESGIMRGLDQLKFSHGGCPGVKIAGSGCPGHWKCKDGSLDSWSTSQRFHSSRDGPDPQVFFRVVARQVRSKIPGLGLYLSSQPIYRRSAHCWLV
jgi:hypothetical protein